MEDFYAAPPTYGRLTGKLRGLRERYSFLRLAPVGQSVVGRSLYAVTLGAAEPCTLFAGAFHAQEWLTCTLLVRFLEELCESIRQDVPFEGIRMREALADRGLAVIPMVNPDGVSIALEGAESAGELAESVRQMMRREERSWQANARGVDLNHNYDAGWQELRRMERESGILRPGPRQFGGPFPHSEPETQAMVEFLRSRRVETVCAFHSQGEEIYSEYGDRTPARSRFFARLLAEASGYTLIENDGLCSHGGFKDYFIHRYRRPGFTFEIGRGENPLPITDLEGIWCRLRGALAMAAVL